MFEKRELAGGLSTYGIIGIREPVETSLAEVEMIAGLGVRMETNTELGTGAAAQLFNVALDVGEREDLAGRHPERVAAMLGKLEKIRASGRSR